MGKKLYPFSVEKHAHDIEFRRNRVKNLIDDYTVGGKPCSDEKFDSLIELDEKLDDLLSAVLSSSDGRIAWLTGEQIGLAKETVAWAYKVLSVCGRRRRVRCNHGRYHKNENA